MRDLIIILPSSRYPSSKIKKNLFNKLIDYNIKYQIFQSKFQKNNKYDFPILKNHTYYFLKGYHIEIFKTLKKLNNKIIYEPLDCDWRDSDYKEKFDYLFKIVDHIIFNNNFVKDLFNLNKKSTTIYHEYDTRFSLNNKLSDSLYYIGTKNKVSLDDKTFKKYNIVNITNFNSIIENNICYRGIHLDFVLPDNNQYTIHTTTKLATALYSKSIFICNKIPLYLDILGDEYEFYFKDDLTDLDIIIKKAKNVINNEVEYNNYLKTQSKYLNYFNPDTIISKYYELFKILCESK